MKYFEIFTGIGGFSLGMPEEYECIGFAEIDKWCSWVLRYNFPNIPNYGDLTKLDLSAIEDFDLLVGGSPCQGLSTAGKMKGLVDPRSNLFYEYIRVLKEKQPKYFLWENVAGALLTNKGADFEEIKKEFTEAGYSFVWNTINTADFGFPIQRNRLFIAGYLGNLSQQEIFPFACQTTSYRKAQRSITPLFTATDDRMFSVRRQRIVVADKGKLRYFTPLERERIMGFDDNWTKYGIDNNDKIVEISDAQRIKMTGNAVHVGIIKILMQHFFNNNDTK